MKNYIAQMIFSHFIYTIKNSSRNFYVNLIWRKWLFKVKIFSKWLLKCRWLSFHRDVWFNWLYQSFLENESKRSEVSCCLLYWRSCCSRKKAKCQLACQSQDYLHKQNGNATIFHNPIRLVSPNLMSIKLLTAPL